jgi:L-amino acid N-acyltransferase YncA
VEKKETLKDGTEVTTRELRPDDIDKLMKFYKSLPLQDRKYLMFNVLDRKTVAQRIRRMESGDVLRIVAVRDNEIVAEGSLELSGEHWSKHQGEIRVIVARSCQHKGLGTIMIRELYFLGIQKKIEVMVARMMRPQVGAQQIFRRLGFSEVNLLPDYVKDISGTTQDLIIMTCNIRDLWKELDQVFRESDWQRCR